MTDNKQKSIELKHELKKLIDGSISNIGRFDKILEELEGLAGSSQYKNDCERLEYFASNF